MKKTAFALISAATLSLPAVAQSNVTMYGLLDMGINQVSNVGGHSVTELRSGNMMASRWGIRGSEDLGAGTKVNFTLETGIGADTGSAGAADTFWNRQSWLGLSKQGMGELRLGRQLSVMNDAFGSYGTSTYMGTQTAALEGSGSAGSAAANYNSMVGGTRLNNVVKFTSADMGGLKVRAMVGFGEKTESSKSGRIESLGVTYKQGAMESSLVYHLRRCDAASNCSDDQVFGLGANYTFAGNVRVGAIATQQKNALNVAGNDANTYAVLALVPVRQWTLMASYQKLDDKSVRDQDINQLNLGVKFALSKRTELYSLFSKQKVGNGGKAGMFSKTSSNGKQNQFNVGIRHSF